MSYEKVFDLLKSKLDWNFFLSALTGKCELLNAFCHLHTSKKKRKKIPQKKNLEEKFCGKNVMNNNNVSILTFFSSLQKKLFTFCQKSYSRYVFLRYIFWHMSSVVWDSWPRTPLRQVVCNLDKNFLSITKEDVL